MRAPTGFLCSLTPKRFHEIRKSFTGDFDLVIWRREIFFFHNGQRAIKSASDLAQFRAMQLCGNPKNAFVIRGPAPFPVAQLRPTKNASGERLNSARDKRIPTSFSQW